MTLLDAFLDALSYVPYYNRGRRHNGTSCCSGHTANAESTDKREVRRSDLAYTRHCCPFNAVLGIAGLEGSGDMVIRIVSHNPFKEKEVVSLS